MCTIKSSYFLKGLGFMSGWGFVGSSMLAATLVAASGSVAVAAAPEPAETPSAPGVSVPKTVELGTSAEAWYQFTAVNTCGSPAGCVPVSPPSVPELPVTPAPYPSETLHVGFTGGIETARTYLKLDREPVKEAATVLGGTLTLPLLTSPTDGTLQVETAGLKACLVTEEFVDGVAGEITTPPAIDCTVSHPLTLEGTAFTVDLAPFFEAWSKGQPDYGIALTPFTSSAVTSAWHVALPGRDLPGATPITGSITYQPLARAATQTGSSVAPAAPRTGGVVTGGLGTVSPGTPAGAVDRPTVNTRPQARDAAAPELTKAGGGQLSFVQIVLLALLLGALAYLLLGSSGALGRRRETAV